MGVCVCGCKLNPETEDDDDDEAFLLDGASERPEFHILTGGPGVGKTSIICALEQIHGEHVVREAAMDVILFHQARRIHQPWTLSDFQDQILKLQNSREKRAAQLKAKRVFLDRGVIDVVAYYEKQNKPISPLTEDALQKLKNDNPYTTVFLIQNFGKCQGNDQRRESIAESLDLEHRQEKNYKKYGFNVVGIPPGKLEKRVQTIIDYVNR